MVTAADAIRRTDLRQRAAGAARCQDRAVVAVLKGWTRGHASKRYAILAALEAEGVDLGTIPRLTGEEQEEMRQRARPRPCPACAAKDAELAGLRAKLDSADDAKHAAQSAVVRLQRELADARDEAEALRARVAELGSPPTEHADPLPSEPVAYPVDAPSVAMAMLPTPPPRQATRQRSPVVRVLMPGEELPG